jgi:hypothetical protein
MIFNVKSINTVYIAGKEVDGMKRPREPPTGGNKMNIGRILPTEAAAILNVSPQFVRVAMQQGKLPIGTAVQMSSIWTYHIDIFRIRETSLFPLIVDASDVLLHILDCCIHIPVRREMLVIIGQCHPNITVTEILID